MLRWWLFLIVSDSGRLPKCTKVYESNVGAEPVQAQCGKVLWLFQPSMSGGKWSLSRLNLCPKSYQYCVNGASHAEQEG